MDVKLARADLGIDARHDGRHVLRDVPLARESIPYCVVMPEHRIALFTYTWVDRDSVAGAAMGIWGPGIGDTPIQAHLPDRPVPRDMDFDAWRIEDFSMRQDLRFHTADVSWKTPEAEIDFRFEAFHPPYAYSNHKGGCPPYAADDRIEQSGTITGTLRIGDRVIDIRTSGHRDHSWGTRDWGALHFYRWIQAQVADRVSVHFWDFFALGERQLRGYVFKQGLMAEITRLDFAWQGDAELNHTAYQCTITDEAGRTTRLEAKVFGIYPLIPDPDFVLNEGASTMIIDGEEGSGWLEMGWPRPYLRYIADSGRYR